MTYRLRINPQRLYEMTADQHRQVTDYLDALHQDIKDEGKPDLVIGLEYVLQALGCPGYEFD